MYNYLKYAEEACLILPLRRLAIKNACVSWRMG